MPKTQKQIEHESKNLPIEKIKDWMDNHFKDKKVVDLKFSLEPTFKGHPDEILREFYKAFTLVENGHCHPITPQELDGEINQRTVEEFLGETITNSLVSKNEALNQLEKSIKQIKNLNQHCMDGPDVSFISEDGRKIEWNLGEAFVESQFFDDIQEAIKTLETTIRNALEQAEILDADYHKNVLKAVEELKYIKGIVEKGEQRELSDDESIAEAILEYVKKLENSLPKTMDVEALKQEHIKDTGNTSGLMIFDWLAEKGIINADTPRK